MKLNPNTIQSVLLTKRLKLRKLLNTDVHEIFLLRSNTIINKYLDRKLCKTKKEALNFIRNVNENIKQNKSFYWGLELLENKKFLGTICIFDISKKNKTCEIGFELLTNFQGNGYMQEAATLILEFIIHSLNIKTIHAFTHPQNINSIHLLQKLKFQKVENINQSNDNLYMFIKRH